MSNKSVLITGVVCGLLLVLLLVLFLGGEEAPEPAPAETMSNATPPAPVPVAPPVDLPPPVVEEAQPPEIVVEPETPEVVLEETPAPPVPEPDPLPGLNNSDPFVLAQIDDLQNSNAILRQLTTMQIIRKFVVLVDGMSRGDIPDRDLPVTRSVADIGVTEISEELYRLDPASYTRFNLLVNTFAALDNAQVAGIYERVTPLLDEAFAELGYPDRTFSAALRQAMNNVLQAQLPRGEILLNRPSVHYRFADPGLESRTDLEKLLIRMGPENAAKVQNKVRELSSLLAN